MVHLFEIPHPCASRTAPGQSLAVLAECENVDLARRDRFVDRPELGRSQQPDLSVSAGDGEQAAFRLPGRGWAYRRGLRQCDQAAGRTVPDQAPGRACDHEQVLSVRRELERPEFVLSFPKPWDGKGTLGQAHLPQPVGDPNPVQLLLLGLIIGKLRGPSKPEQSQSMIVLFGRHHSRGYTKIDQLALRVAVGSLGVTFGGRLSSLSLGGTKPEDD